MAWLLQYSRNHAEKLLLSYGLQTSTVKPFSIAEARCGTAFVAAIKPIVGVKRPTDDQTTTVLDNLLAIEDACRNDCTRRLSVLFLARLYNSLPYPESHHVERLAEAGFCWVERAVAALTTRTGADHWRSMAVAELGTDKKKLYGLLMMALHIDLVRRQEVLSPNARDRLIGWTTQAGPDPEVLFEWLIKVFPTTLDRCDSSGVCMLHGGMRTGLQTLVLAMAFCTPLDVLNTDVLWETVARNNPAPSARTKQAMSHLMDVLALYDPHVDRSRITTLFGLGACACACKPAPLPPAEPAPKRAAPTGSGLAHRMTVEERRRLDAVLNGSADSSA